MNDSMQIFIVTDDAKAVLLEYNPDDKRDQPTIAKTFRTDLMVGDTVIVETNTRHRMTVAKVLQTDIEPDIESETWVPWIVEKVSLDAFRALQDKEAGMIVAIKKAEKTIARKTRQQQLQEVLGHAALPNFSE